MIEEIIRKRFTEYPNVIYGFTGVSYCPYISQYQSAIVMAVPYGEQLTLQTYTEERFERGIQEARKVIEEILAQLEEILNRYGVKYHIPPTAQNNEEDLLAPFSFKYAAVNAGLGWIGKNDVLITERYGPRVRLSAVLIDAPFAYGRKIEKSGCPDSCRKCVDSCPYHALYGRQWEINSKRSDIINYQLCNQKRSLFLKKLGRKNACGLCMAVCPVGTSLGEA